ncbi:MAG: ATP-binding cassette domain-containing protein, partial [Clostridia bacterium]|nr:ATP-binding cassette domain-containing protein [Clostridia bacterium]
VHNVSFQVRKGEIVCIAGIDGNGQTELVYGITGLEKPNAGKIIFHKREPNPDDPQGDPIDKEIDVTHRSIRERSNLGMNHIPEDRHKHGLILDFTLEQNMVLQRYFEPQFQKHGFIKFGEIRRYSDELIEDFDVRSGQGSITIARSMSGGNQQKAIVARELRRDHDLLVAVQPTRGLDVGAIEYIHEQIVKDRDSGAAVLLVSLELEEVMNLSDRILVIYEGELVAEVDPKQITVQELGLYMAGAKRMEGFESDREPAGAEATPHEEPIESDQNNENTEDKADEE